jgi:ribosomal protein L29
MKTSKTKLITKKKMALPDSITKLRQTLFLLKLERRAGRLLKTDRIKVLRKEIARNLTKINQQKRASENGSKLKGGGI